MMKSIRKLGSLAWVFLLILCVASIAGASDFGPRKNPGQRSRNNVPVSVAEPAAIALLAAGLVTLGFYAKKKRGRKQ